jgi:uncharacterized membrane protein YkvA (DUF1232 family)
MGEDTTILKRIRSWARQLKRDAVMLWFAKDHPDTPTFAKVVCVLAVAYALSPIDLIPDFIPVLGYLDDLLLVPGMVWVAIRMLPPHVILRCRLQADVWLASHRTKPTSYAGAAVIVIAWVAIAYAAYRWFMASA